jgi:hypothetical protein
MAGEIKKPTWILKLVASRRTFYLGIKIIISKSIL